jgi:hypothetical protein
VWRWTAPAAGSLPLRSNGAPTQKSSLPLRRAIEVKVVRLVSS